MRASRIVRVALVGLALASVASAGEGDDKQAKASFAEGNRLFDAGDFIGALEKFRRTYALTSNPKVLLNLGTTYRQLGRFVEAAEAYETYLSDPKADAARRAEVQDALAQSLAKSGTLTVSGPPGAKLTVDGKPIDADKAVRLDVGDHQVRVEHGGSTQLRSVIITPGAAKEETFAAAKPTPPSAKRAVTTREQAPQARASDWPTEGLVAIGGGAALTVIGAVFALKAKSDYGHAQEITDSASSYCTPTTTARCKSERDSANDKGDANARLARPLVVVGVLAMSGGLAYSLWQSRDADAAVALAPGTIGARIRGAW